MPGAQECALRPSHGECRDVSIVLGDWIKVSASVAQGKFRPTMEDRVLITNVEVNDRSFALIVVLDGHGGSEAVDFVFANFKSMLQTCLKRFDGNMRKCLLHTFYLLDAGVQTKTSGTTVSCLLVDLSSRIAWLATVGDSSVFGVKNGRGSKLSVDHNLKNSSEVARIAKLADFSGVTKDGYVCNSQGDMLNMTRAIGDHNFGDIVIATPTIKKVTNFDVVVLATDGIWDVLDIRTVIALMSEATTWAGAAPYVNEARNRLFAQHDNTSIVFVFMNFATDAGT
jgi:serine/threonine protein phosphatase PrpC